MILMLGGVGSSAEAQSTRDLLSAELEPGEANVWYLGHAGWAVKTRNHLLIFDYWESSAPRGDRSLADGYVNAEEIAAQAVYVFVTHSHGDHYDPIIHRWRQTVPNITYVFGWEAGSDPDHIYMTQPREIRELGDLTVATINHEFDQIPEVAFLVAVDDLVIYHSGDHGTVTEEPNATFVDNIDYLASLGRRIDVAFISTFGRIGGGTINNGDRYSIEKLRPRVMFPMHHGDNEDLYERFAREIRREDVMTAVYYATRPGDHFSYKAGRIERR
jgi:L-ascorbate metabolism protein UlaG (beta-lactamase superfamily)